jgi:uncharacterized protein YmfQ (DUF2313 family)
MDAEAYLAQLRALLPPGAALSREAGSPLLGMLGVTAAELARVDARGAQLLAEAVPDTANEILAEWERAFGLPDECSAALTLIEQRRAALVARVTERLSPNLPTIEALSRAFGVRASVVEHRPHTCEMGCETPVNDEAWAHAWTLWGSGRVVSEASCEDDCEQPLRLWADLPHECAVRRLAPAHTVPLFGSFTNEWSFLSDLPAGATFTRPAAANRVNQRGLTEAMAANVPRLGYRSGLTYNLLGNPWADGVVAGSPGTNPPDWGFHFSNDGTLNRTIIGIGVENRVPYYEVRCHGVIPTGSYQIIIVLGTGVPGAPGDTFSASVFARLMDGALPTSFGLWVQEVSSTFMISLVDVAPTNAPLDTQRVDLTRTFTQPDATGANSLLITNFLAAGTVVDFTLRIGFPVLTRSAVPLLNSVPLPTLAARINTTPQYGLLGTMLEAAAAEELRLAVPDGLYTAEITAATPAGVIATYQQPLLVSIGGSLRFDWPPAAVAAGANHLRNLILRKVA